MRVAETTPVALLDTGKEQGESLARRVQLGNKPGHLR